MNNQDPEPFSLERAKAGEPICTRDGRPARFIAHVPDTYKLNERVVVYIGGSLMSRCEDGKYMSDDVIRSFDLVMAPRPTVKRTVWVARYRSLVNPKGWDFSGRSYDSESDCLKESKESSYFIETCPVEITEPAPPEKKREPRRWLIGLAEDGGLVSLGMSGSKKIEVQEVL